MMNRFVCIHGHFYQPPRENPWTDTVMRQSSAAPFHDWNARITRECYARNAAARILRRDGQISRLVNNYAWISFDIGPTLMRWMERNERAVYDAILDADRASCGRCGGHGSAIAQGYHHAILPLSNERDRRTEIIWGRRDFEKRYGREPEGIWLPETAVDIPTLEAVAEHGFRFTILAPHQARRVRPCADAAAPWQDVTADSLDNSMPYLARLPSGRSLALFFYDGPTSRGVAFEKLLDDGATFVERLRACFAGGDHPTDRPRLVQIATDGETYGHHHRFGEMALAFATQAFAASNAENAEGGPRLTNYGEFLELHPPTYEVEIAERTSWSCAHGIERWRSDCGCRIGHEQGWNQAWRAGVRDAFDWLRDSVATPFAERGSALFSNPWAARDAYIEVVLDRSPASIDRFLATHARGPLDAGQRSSALRLMELQRHLLMTYTSCGWFFDEVSGVEPRQNLRCAAMAIELCHEEFQIEREREFRSRLSAAKSNVDEYDSGGDVYDRVCIASVIGPVDVAIHAAASLYLGAPLPTDFSRAHVLDLTDATRETLGGRAFYAWHFAITSALTGVRSDVGVVLLNPRLPFALPQLRAGNNVDIDRHGQMLVALHQAGADGATACFGRFGYLPVKPRPARLRRLISAATQLLSNEGDGGGGRASLAFGALCAAEPGIDPMTGQLLAAAVQRRLLMLLTEANPRERIEIEPEALLTVLRTHNLEIDKHLLGGVAVASTEQIVDILVATPRDTEALLELERLVELVTAFTLDCDLWQVEHLCVALLRRPPVDSSSDWHDALHRLATRLRIGLAATLA